MWVHMARTRRAPSAPIIKAHVITRADASGQEPEKKRESLPWLDPPYDPEELAKHYENSSLVRPNVCAYVTNIDSVGHQFEPAIDLLAPDALTQVADAMFLDRVYEAEADGGDLGSVAEPTADEVQAKLVDLRRQARLEHAKLRLFFSYCCPGTTFTTFRRQTREDQEVFGTSYWEIIRSGEGVPARLVRAPAINMRATKQSEEYVEVTQRIPVSPLRWIEVQQWRLFRRYVQLDEDTGQPAVWFKEFGDPRVVSRTTGTFFATEDELVAKEGETAKPATEILSFRINSVRTTAYGIPRWGPVMPVVVGSRENEEVNLAYFENKSVPPLALLVNGGRLGKGAMTKLEDFFEENLKGKKNFHRILILEAEPARGAGSGPSAVPKMSFEKLRDAQQQDALFQNYEERNDAKVGAAFRMPRILRGDDRQINKATVYGSMRLAEDQVFEPERTEFDAALNANLLPALGVCFWRFRTNAPVTRDPEILGAITVDLVKVGVLTPGEGRAIAKDIFSKDLPNIQAPWIDQPLALTLAAVRAGVSVEAILGASLRDAIRTTETESPPQSSSSSGLGSGLSRPMPRDREEPHGGA